MEHLEGSCDVQADAETCWEVVTDPAFTCAWLTIADEVTAADEPGPGQRLQATVTVLGHTVRVEQTVETWEPPTHYAYTGSEPTDITFRFHIQERDDATEVRLRVEADVSGVPKLARRAATRALRGQLNRSMTRLGRVIEVEQARR